MVGERAPIVEKLPPFANHPAFMAAHIRDALARLDVAPSRTRQMFTGVGVLDGDGARLAMG